MRIGLGFDSHPLVEGRALVLGAVEIPFPEGLLGHSDGDVVLHALCDAFLGSAGLGDIGEHFPDTDPTYMGAKSTLFLERCLEMLQERHLKPSSIDINIFADAPRLGPWKSAIRKRLSALLKLPEGRINVKAKTLEGFPLFLNLPRSGGTVPSSFPISAPRLIAAEAVALVDEEP